MFFCYASDGLTPVRDFLIHWVGVSNCSHREAAVYCSFMEVRPVNQIYTFQANQLVIILKVFLSGKIKKKTLKTLPGRQESHHFVWLVQVCFIVQVCVIVKKQTLCFMKRVFKQYIFLVLKDKRLQQSLTGWFSHCTIRQGNFPTSAEQHTATSLSFSVGTVQYCLVEWA